MTEGMTAMLLVLTEVGGALIVVFVIAGSLAVLHRRRKRLAVDRLLEQVSEAHEGRRLTLNGWLTQSFGYGQGEAERLADRVLAAESDLYRQLVAAIHDRDPDGITGLPAKVEALTFLYRDLPQGGGKAHGDDPVFIPTGEEPTGEEPTRLGEDDEPPDTPIADDRPSAAAAMAQPEAYGGTQPPAASSDDMVGPQTPATREVADGPEEIAGQVSGEVSSRPNPDTPDRGAAETRDDIEEPAYSDDTMIDNGEDERDPLDDLLDSPEEPVKEPPVHR